MRVHTEEGNNFHGFISDDIDIMFVSHISSFFWNVQVMEECMEVVMGVMVDMDLA